MDGVVHPNVEQAIGRDRIRKALKRYENRPADEHRYGIVRSVNEDGSYEVLLDGDVQTSRCAQYGTALVGDRVLAVTKKDGRNDLIGRLGGEIGGTETIAPTIEKRFEGIEADILDMRTNKVLWSGASYMRGSQTATLSKAISAQPNGVVLVWSYYDNSAKAARDWDFTFTFIPKYMVSAFSQPQVSCFMVSAGLSVVGQKEVSVYDTKIVGDDRNDDEGTGAVDLIYMNSAWVLRRVIGV